MTSLSRLPELPSHVWMRIERAVEDFENAWRDDRRPALDDYLSAHAGLRATLLIELAHADLECRLRAGEPARAEDYLRKYPELEQDATAALSLAALEYRVRCKTESEVSIQEYVDRFPAHAAALAEWPQSSGLADRGSALLTTPELGGTDVAGTTDQGRPSARGSRVRLRDPGVSTELQVHDRDASIPRLAGRCRIRGELARGGMGAVLLGHDPELGRDLAVKVLLTQYADQPDLVHRFLIEAQVGGQLQHPGTVPVYELGKLSDARPYFTMKLVRGRTLASQLAQRDPQDEPAASPSELPRFLKIFEQVCQTMAYAHARGVIHRDLKPANVMVGAFGEVQVMDWGLAKVLDAAPDEHSTPVPGETRLDDLRLTRDGSIAGTPAYMAPEQARGEPEHLDPRCDVFGLGAVLCEILTGQPPFVATTRSQILEQAQRGDLKAAFQRLDSCGGDAELLDLARTCLAAARDARPTDAGIVAERMTGYLNGVQERLHAAEVERAAAQARAEEARAKAVAERRARRLTVGLAAAGLLLLVLGGAVGLLIKQHRDARAAEAARQLAEAASNAREAMQEATLLRERANAWTDDPAKWASTFAAALSAARRAEEGLAGGDGPEELREQALALRIQLEEDERDRLMAERLDVINLKRYQLRFGRIDNSETSKEYTAAYRDYGIDLDTLPVEEAAARIRSRPIKDRLVAGLYTWVSISLELTRNRQRAAVARVASPELAAWLDQLVPAVRKKDRRAIRALSQSPPASARTPVNLLLFAAIMRMSGAGAEALALLNEAHRQHPNDFWINHELGIHYLYQQPPQLDQAVRFFTAAVAIQPDNPLGRVALADALLPQGAVDDAIACYEEALRRQPEAVLIHWQLGRALREKGELGRSLDEFRRSHELAQKTPVVPGPAAEWASKFEQQALEKQYHPEQLAAQSLCEAERLVELEKQLPAVLSGQLKPDPKGKLELADMCRYKKLYATMVRLYHEAFTADASLASDPQVPHRYNAACAAALAGCRQGSDVAKLDAKELAGLRGQALEWLRADLEAWAKSAQSGAAKRMLQHWQSDSDLAGVRDPAPVAKLPPAEQEAWRKLWSDVVAALETDRQ